MNTKYLADVTYTNLLKGIDRYEIGADKGVGALEKIVSQIIGILSVVAVIHFAIQVILAGYAFMNAQGDSKQLETARKRLTDGVLGITIVMVATGLAALISTLLGIDSIFNLGTMFTNLGL